MDILRDYCVVFLLLTLRVGITAAAEIPIAQEPAYTRAVIALNRSEFDRALTLVEDILKTSPAAFQALELKALCHKGKGQDTEAMRTFGELVRVGPVSQKPKYYFEIGNLLHKNRRYAQARPYLNAALQGGFNIGAAHFFLGLIDFEDKQFDSAERHFVATINSNALDLKGHAYFYLVIVYFKTGYPIGAIRGMRYARDMAETWKKSADPAQKKSAEDISDTSRKILKSLDRVRWFGNITMLTQYDSNATLLPDSVKAAAQVASKQSLKQIFTGGGGIVTSPARLFQAVASYRTFLNYNFNSDAKSFDFFTHIPAVYLNYKPFLRLTPGMKIEGNYTFQNKAGRENSIEFHPYSLSADIGPYVRYEVNPHLIAQFEAFFRPKKYYDDRVSGDDRRGGDGFIFRGSVEYTSPWKYLMPTAYLSYENDRTNGKNFASTAYGLGMNNTARFSSINAVTFGFDFRFPRFLERIPIREETNIEVRAAWVHELTRHFSLLVNANYASTRSSLEGLFTYNRFYGGVGLDYTF